MRIATFDAITKWWTLATVAAALMAGVGLGNAVAGGLGDLGSSEYRIINTITGACSSTKRWPGGDVGLAALRSQYPSPLFVVDYGGC